MVTQFTCVTSCACGHWNDELIFMKLVVALYNERHATNIHVLMWWIVNQHIEAERKWPSLSRRHLFNYIFLNEKVWISIKISLKFVPKDPINNIPALVQIMAWRRPGDKPLSETMLDSLLTHICVTRPQWVNTHKRKPKGLTSSWLTPKTPK